MTRHFSTAAPILAIALLASACNEQDAAQPKAAKVVAVVQPKMASVTRYRYETGTAKALDSVDIVARVAGTLKSIDYADGKEVKAGQRLFLIEPDQYDAQVQQAEASVEQARATLDNAARQLDRQDQLARTSVTTETNVDNARASRDTAKAQLDAAQASLREAQINLGYTTITAPFDGFVTEHEADVGALVGSGGTTKLATIVRLDPVHVSFTVSDKDMLQIRAQARKRGLTPKDLDKITVEAATPIDDGFPHTGKLDYVSPQTDPQSGTLSVRALFDNHNRDLLPGLFLRIRVPVETIDDALLIPPSAIGSDQEGRYVLAVNGSGVIERRAVSLLERQGELQQVKGTMSPDDWIVGNVVTGVRAGEVVTKRETALPSAGPQSFPDPAAATQPGTK